MQKGRKLALLISAFIAIAAILIMIVGNVWFLIVGRLIYGFSGGLFSSVSVRYVEECSPP